MKCLRDTIQSSVCSVEKLIAGDVILRPIGHPDKEADSIRVIIFIPATLEVARKGQRPGVFGFTESYRAALETLIQW